MAALQNVVCQVQQDQLARRPAGGCHGQGDKDQQAQGPVLCSEDMGNRADDVSFTSAQAEASIGDDLVEPLNSVLEPAPVVRHEQQPCSTIAMNAYKNPVSGSYLVPIGFISEAQEYFPYVPVSNQSGPLFYEPVNGKSTGMAHDQSIDYESSQSYDGIGESDYAAKRGGWKSQYGGWNSAPRQGWRSNWESGWKSGSAHRRQWD